MVAAAVVAAGVVGAVATSVSSSNAADAQTSASNNSIAAQKAQQAQTVQGLQQYNQTGQYATNWLQSLSGVGPGQDPTQSYFGPIAPPAPLTEDALQQTPGYQFTRAQGLKAVQNSAAARGLGVSGAALKGAATYATGLADSTYQNQFNNLQTQWSDQVANQTNVYNRLSGIASLGENAAAQTGSLGTQTAANIGNNLVGAGNAQAGAAMATGNAISGAASSAGNAYLTNSLLRGSGSNGIYDSSNTFAAQGYGNYGAALYNPGANSGVTSPY